MVRAKGYRELIDFLAKNRNELEGFKLDVYGNGQDSLEVQSTARKLDLNLNFLRGRDHADDSLHGFKVFINPSVSDVLCTATAEALAMGKFVVCADHPSYDFVGSFPNCLTYKTPEDFVSKVKEALSSEPQPLTPEQRYTLSWEAATQRFVEYSELDKVLNDNKRSKKIGEMVRLGNQFLCLVCQSLWMVDWLSLIIVSRETRYLGCQLERYLIQETMISNIVKICISCHLKCRILYMAGEGNSIDILIFDEYNVVRN